VKFFLNKRVSSGALQYTLFVAVLIVLLVSTFLTLSYLQNHFKHSTDFQIQSIQNADIGFQFVSANEIPYEEEKTIELSTDIDSHIVLTKKHWGIFDLLNVQSKVKNSSFQKIGLIGGFQKEKLALYLKDNKNALVLVGNTEIRGAVLLPKSGVKRGNISGHSYYGDQLIYGATTQSGVNLPAIKNRTYIEQLTKEDIAFKDAVFMELEEGLKIINSFNQSTQIYKQQGIVNLRAIQLIGNIIIQSDTLIKIEQSAQLNDVLLIAPKIHIMNQVTGNFQAIASKNITVGSNCNLIYPSVLVLNEEASENSIKNKKDGVTSILINSNTSIKGIVAFLSNDKTSNYMPQIIMEENSEVVGEVYCDKNFELKGEVLGSVYTSGFLAKQYGSIYQNHIYNGSILQNKLPKQYVGLPIENSIPKVSKWLF
jgi:cytoskeletal protein CcmA (bactofilin family)